MTLTRHFKETILARARRDTRFRRALLSEAINAYLAGDTAAGKANLRDPVNSPGSSPRAPTSSPFRGLSEGV